MADRYGCSGYCAAGAARRMSTSLPDEIVSDYRKLLADN